MPLVNIARDLFADAIIGGSSYTKFDNANAYIGVGDSSTAFNVSQTDLQASSNKVRKAMDGGYPTRTNNVLEFQATFGESDANFQWEERGLFNHASAGQMLCRIVDDLGEKTSAHIWVYKLEATVGLGS